MMELNRRELDFDRWSEMAKTDPDAFESMREALISEFIESASPERQPRLRGLQWRIDEERRRSGSSMGACIRISNMMWETLAGSGGLMEQLTHLKDTVSGEPREAPVSRPEAKIIPIGFGRA